MVYYRDPESKVTPQQQIAVDVYMDNSGRAERRSPNYYSGYPVFSSIGSKGFYFTMLAQQRDTVDVADRRNAPRGFNPKSGKVLYIGQMGQRPSGWEAELEQIKADAAAAAEAS